MNFKRTITLLAFAAMPAFSQTLGFEANVSLAIGVGDMARLTSGNDLAGSSIDLGVRLDMADGFSHRFHVGLLGVKGKPGTGLEGAAPKHLMFGYDVMQEFKKWTFYGGLMAVKWKHDDGTTTDPNFGDIVVGTTSTNNSPKGTKLGARIGTEYAFTNNLRGVLGYNQTEFNKRYQPGWWNLGVTFRF